LTIHPTRLQQRFRNYLRHLILTCV